MKIGLLAARKMVDLLLVDRRLEPLVRGEPVVAQDAGQVRPDHPLQDIGTSL